MKHFVILFIALIFSFLSCSSEAPAHEITEEEGLDDVIVSNGNSLLWKIEKKGSKTSYMYGTMHMIDAEYYHFTDKMTERIKRADAVIMEVGGMPNPLETLELMKLDSGDIRSVFSDEQMRVVVEFFDTRLGTDPDTFFQVYGGMKPFFILQAITQNYFSTNTESYDLDIMSIAGESQIPLIGLETLEEQLGFFEAIPKEAMAEMVVESVNSFDDEKKSTLKMMKIYAKQRVDKLIPLMEKQSPEIMEYGDIFLYNRNKAWIPKLKTELDSKKCFIAVGAAHLFGEDGLIDLLKKEGYTLTAVSTESAD